MRFPRFRPVADRAVLVEFGETISPETHDQVLNLDRLLAAHPIPGATEAIPAYVNLLVTFDPLQTDHETITAALETLLHRPAAPRRAGQRHSIRICYDDAPDLADVARQTGLTRDQVIAAHLAGQYEVWLYGFAPGYAYLAGVPPALHLPRKHAALRDVPSGSVIIAGGQCIITTLTMPTGWWIIGASPDPVLRDDPARPFRFEVGDRLRFQRISRAQFDAL